MKSFETVYNELEELLIKKLPEYIEKINKLHNDGLIIKPFENTSLEENCIKQPSFKLTFTSGEYTEKDRIIENEVYNIKIEIKQLENQKKKITILSRYVETINKLFAEEETNYDYKITIWNDTTIQIYICGNK